METVSIISHGIPVEFIKEADRDGGRVLDGLLWKGNTKSRELLNNEMCGDGFKKKLASKEKNQVRRMVYILPESDKSQTA